MLWRGAVDETMGREGHDRRRAPFVFFCASVPGRRRRAFCVPSRARGVTGSDPPLIIKNPIPAGAPTTLTTPHQTTRTHTRDATFKALPTERTSHDQPHTKSPGRKTGRVQQKQRNVSRRAHLVSSHATALVRRLLPWHAVRMSLVRRPATGVWAAHTHRPGLLPHQSVVATHR